MLVPDPRLRGGAADNRAGKATRWAALASLTNFRAVAAAAPTIKPKALAFPNIIR